jgi:hypothetical protein
VNGPYRAFQWSRIFADGLEGVIAIAGNAAGCADPQSAGAILEEALDEIAAELRRVLAREDLKPRGVEADQTGFGADPQIPVAGLQHGMDGVLRQPAVRLPRLIAVMAQALVRIERDANPCKGQQRGDGDNHGSPAHPSSHSSRFTVLHA